MQDRIPKFRQNPNISGKLGYLFQKLKALASSPTAIECNIFCWNFTHVVYGIVSTKGCSGFFLFYLDFGLLIKI